MDAVVRFAGFSTYGDYLAGPHWLAMRRFWCKQGATCYGCGKFNKPLQIHHISYLNLGNEQAVDFVPVCRDCHERIHQELAARFPKAKLGHQAELTPSIWQILFGRSLSEARDVNGHFRRYDYFKASDPAKSLPARQKKQKLKKSRRKAGQQKKRMVRCYRCLKRRIAQPDTGCECGGRLVKTGKARRLHSQYAMTHK